MPFINHKTIVDAKSLKLSSILYVPNSLNQSVIFTVIGNDISAHIQHYQTISQENDNRCWRNGYDILLGSTSALKYPCVSNIH